jgi:hypothetical protein
MLKNNGPRGALVKMPVGRKVGIRPWFRQTGGLPAPPIALPAAQGVARGWLAVKAWSLPNTPR